MGLKRNSHSELVEIICRKCSSKTSKIRVKLDYYRQVLATMSPNKPSEVKVSTKASHLVLDSTRSVIRGHNNFQDLVNINLLMFSARQS